LRTLDAVFVPTLLASVVNSKVGKDYVSFSFTDKEKIFIAALTISTSINGIKFEIKCESERPVWILEWKIDGLDFDEVLVPALGGQAINKSMPEGTLLSYKYPFWWNAQFVLGSIKSGGIILRTEDKSTDLKLLRVSKENGKFSLSLGFEAKAPVTKKEFSAEWFVDSYEGKWQNGVEVHRKWMEKNFKLIPFSSHPHFPGWANDIKFVLEIWGARKDRELPAHTFEQMRQRIIEWSNLYPAKNTLLYLPGFAEHGIDSNAPSYNPSDQCGGADEFMKLIKTAHSLSYKVMIHTNVIAMTFVHPLYKKFKRYQVIDVFERLQGWAMDMDGDWLTEPYFAYMNPGFKQWGDLMIKIIGELISKYKIDAVFLDQTLLAFNVSKGPDFVKGMRDHVQRLQVAFPNVLFAGEGLHEQNVRCLPMAQIHGIDSIFEVHAMEGKAPWRKAHPISTYLFGKYTKFTAHLLTKHPSNSMFKEQEEAYKKLNVIPALCLYDSKQEINSPEVKKMITRSKNL